MPFNQSLTLIVAGLYYFIAGLFIFFSLFTIYVLIRYGRSRTISSSVAVVYSLFFISVLSASFISLQSLLKNLNA